MLEKSVICIDAGHLSENALSFFFVFVTKQKEKKKREKKENALSSDGNAGCSRILYALFPNKKLYF